MPGLGQTCMLYPIVNKADVILSGPLPGIGVKKDKE